MSKQNQLRNRLNDLFADLGEERTPLDVEGESVPGWRWDSDAQGLYTGCSSEVIDFLGIQPEEFVGQHFDSFRLSAPSAALLASTLKDGHFPAEIPLDYLATTNETITARVHIFLVEADNGEPAGWRGFNQVVSKKPVSKLERTKEILPPAQVKLEPVHPEPAPRTAAIPLGYAAEEDRVVTISTPYSAAGYQSLQNHQTISQPTSPDSPATLAVPISLPDQSLGLLEIIDDGTYRDWSTDELRLVEEVADQLSLALENARLFQAEQQGRQVATTLSDIARVVGASLDLQEVADGLLARLTEVVDFNTASLQIVEGNQTRRIADLSKIGSVKTQDRSELFGLISDDPLIQEVVTSRKPLVVPDTHNDPRWEKLLGTVHVRSWVAVPLLSGEQVIGLLILDHATPGVYDDETANLLSAIAAQASVAIRNAQLFEQIQDRSRQLQTAAEVSRAASSILEPNPLIQQTVNLIRDRFDLYYVGMFLVDEAGLWTQEPGRWAVLLAGTGEAGRIQIERAHKLEIGGGSMIGQCISTAEAQVSQHVGDEEQRFVNPLLPETRSEMALPLVSRGQVMGAMTIQSEEVAAFTDEDISVLQTMADQVANALQNANLFNQTQARAEELSVLNEMGRELTSVLEIQAIVRSIYLYSSRLLDTSTFLIALSDPDTQIISYPLATENNNEITIPSQKLEAGMTEYVLRTRQPLLIHEDIEGWLREQGVELKVVGFIPQSWLGVPMLVGDQAIGIIAVQSELRQHFNNQHRDLLVAIASQSAIAIQNARLFTQTQDALAETEALLNVTKVASSSLELQASLTEVLDLVLAATGFDAGLISVANLDTNRLELVSHRLPTPMLTSLQTNGLEGTLCDIVYQKGETQVIQDIENESPVDPTGLLALGFTGYIGVPLSSKGKTLGTLCAFRRTPMASLHDTNIILIEAAGQQVGVAIENANLFEQTLRQTEDLDVLNEMARVLAGLLEVESIANVVYEYTIRLIETKNLSIALYDEEMGEITFPFVLNEGEKILQSPRKLGEGGLTDYIIQTGETLSFEDNVLENMQAIGVDIIPMGNGEIPQSWLGTPMVIGTRVIGVIVVQSLERPRQYTERHQDLLLSIASQAAIAIQNAYLFEQTQNQLADLMAIQATTSGLSTALSFHDVVDILLNHLAGSVQADTVSIFTLRGQDLLRVGVFPPLEGEENLEDMTISLEDYPLTKRVVDTGRPMAIAADDPRLQAHARESFREAGIIANATIPLASPEGVLGTLSLNRKAPGRMFTTQEVNLLATLANQAAISIQNARLFEDSQRRAAQLETAAEIARDTSATLSLDDLLSRSVNLIRNRFNFYHASIFLLDDSGFNAVVRASTGEAGAEMIRTQHSLAVGSKSIVGTATGQGKPVVVNDVTQDPTHRPHPLLPNTRAELGIPMKISERVIGALDVQAVDVNAFNPDDIAVLQTLADQISVAIDNARSYELAQEAIAETQRRVQDLTIISQVSQALAGAPLVIQEVAHVISRQFFTAIETSEVSVSLLQDNMLEVVSDFILEDGVERIDEEYIGHTNNLSDFPATAQVIQERQPLVIQASDPNANAIELSYMAEQNISTLVILPLAVKGQSFGVIELENKGKERAYTEQEINLLTTLANQAAVALENARLYEEQSEIAEQLRELDKLKSQFLANMSHELRTPLNSIIGFSRVIMKGIDGPVTDLQQQDLSAIYNAGQHLLNMINDILDISKIEAGKMELAFEETYIPDIINSVLSTARGLIKDKPIQLVTAIAEDIPRLIADPTRVRQILLNLISNASKFTEEGSITVSAQVRPNKKGTSEIIVTVADTGIGIAPADQETLFQPFTQVDGSPTRKAGGTGLGLSITKLLVELHGGTITVKSVEGQGSTFSFTLPLPQVASTLPETDGEISVLAIDDDRQVISLYERYLSGAGYQVIPLTDPSQALEYARKVKPFAITLDIMMPDFDGWQLLKEMKADPDVGQIPIIICSILEESEKGLKLGAEAYLTKPILEEELVKALKGLKSNSKE
jgi:GAF domain-containing protein